MDRFRHFLSVSVLLTLSALPSLAQTPGFVQAYGHPVEQSNSAIPDLFQCACVKMKVPNPSPSTGNSFVLWETWGNVTQTVTVTASSGTVTAVPATPLRDAGNGQSLQMWVVSGVTLGDQSVTLTFSGATLPTHTGGMLTEWFNLVTASPVDGSCTGNPSATTVVACSAAITTTQANDLIVQACTNDNPGGVTSWTAGAAPWALIDNDRMSPVDNHCGQWQVKPTAGSITPSMTSGTSGTFLTIAVALKATTSGGPLSSSGLKVLKTVGNVSGDIGRTSPYTIQLTCPANTNFVSGAWIGSPDLTGVTGSSSGAWNSAGASNVNGASGTVHWYTKAVTGPLDETLTMTTVPAAGATFDQFMIACMQNAQGIDTASTCPAGSTKITNTCQATGSQATTGLYNVSGIVPSTANGVLLEVTGQASNNSDPPSASPQTAYLPPDENNTALFFYNPTATSTQFQNFANVGAPGAWASQSIAIIAATGGGGGAGTGNILLKGVSP